MILKGFISITVLTALVTVSCSTQKQNQKLVDSDLDGVHDMRDACPYEAGSIFNLGCPNENKQLSLSQIDQLKSTDTDLDGVMDDKDECPLMYGSPFNQGCPIDSSKK